MRTKDDSKIEKIQAATAAIILEEGAAAVSTVKVAKRVGISQSNVYLYFKNKDALLMSVFERQREAIKASGELEALRDQTVPVATRVRRYVHGVYDFACADPDSLELIQQIKLLQGQPLIDEPDNVVRALLQEAITAGVLRPLPINVLMAMIFATIRTHTQNLKYQRYTEADYTFAQLFDLLWQGMRQAS